MTTEKEVRAVRFRRVVPVLVLIAAMVVAAGSPVPRGAPGDDPLVLFGKLMPVLMHPRCLNCHGGVDPTSGTNHGGGVQEAGTCGGCHTDTVKEEWHLATNIFVGKDVGAMCAHIADFVMHTGHASFIDHLQNDELVTLGFAGLMGGARDTTVPSDPPADPPPMKQQEFVDSAKVPCWMA